MQKAKKYDWKDSNMALFGSDTDKKVKKESAECEPAWQGAGQSVGLQIWRIVKFKVESWPKEDYGEFFEGDSYIVLNTYKEEEELKYDVHFWIGKFSTQDEYGTAAYKTVELDTFMDDKPIQHREVQGHESSLFKSYFKTMEFMKGGADTGFRHVAPEEYAPRLLQFSRDEKKAIKMMEVNRNQANLNTGDVFIMDKGLELIQWNGKECNKMETFSAAQFIQDVKSKRGGKPRTTIYEEDDLSAGHPFYELFDQDEDDEADAEPEGEPVLMKVSDEDGSLDMELVKEGSISRDELGSDDVYIIDSKTAKLGVFVWIGSGASVDERKNAMTYAHNYLKSSPTPYLAISVIMEGKENTGFKDCVPGCA